MQQFVLVTDLILVFKYDLGLDVRKTILKMRINMLCLYIFA